MNVTDKSWQPNTGSRYRTASQSKDADDAASRLLKSFNETQKSAEKSNPGFKMKSSSPDDSVGQLAALLAKAETRMDVIQVSGKAMRALANLKMAAMSSDKKEAKKIAQKIKRMEKLIKKIQQKLKYLGKEEQLEERRKQAAKKMQKAKEEELAKEISKSKTKRRREERRYAMKELAADEKSDSDETFSGISGTDSMFSPEFSAGADTGGIDVSSASFEAGSIDMLV